MTDFSDLNSSIQHYLEVMHLLQSMEAEAREYEILLAIELQGFHSHIYDQDHLDKFIQNAYDHLSNLRNSIMKYLPVYENDFGHEWERITGRISTLIKYMLSCAVNVKINK